MTDAERPAARPGTDEFARRDVLRGTAAAAVGISALALPNAAQAFSLTSNGVPLDSVTVYWSDRSNPSTASGRIGRLVYRGLDLGIDTVQGDWATEIRGPRQLLANAGFIYYVVPFTNGDAATTGVWRVSQADPTSRQRVVADASILGIDIEGDDLYYAKSSDGIFRIPKDGSGTAVRLVTVTNQIVDVKVAGASLLFSAFDDDEIRSIPKEGGSATTLTAMSGPNQIWVAGSTLYVTVQGTRTVRKFNVTDGTSLGQFSTDGFVSGIQVLGDTVFVGGSNSTSLAASGVDGGNRDVFARPFDVLPTNSVDGIAVVP